MQLLQLIYVIHTYVGYCKYTKVIIIINIYQTGNSNSQSATCSLLPDMQYNCTAEFAVDIIPSVDTIESVNVTVSGPYGSASSLKNVSQG